MRSTTGANSALTSVRWAEKCRASTALLPTLPVMELDDEARLIPEEQENAAYSWSSGACCGLSLFLAQQHRLGIESECQFRHVRIVVIFQKGKLHAPVFVCHLDDDCNFGSESGYWFGDALFIQGNTAVGYGSHPHFDL